MASDDGFTRAPLSTAAEYSALGLAVMPECTPTCSCSHPGKRPWDPVAGRHMGGWQERGGPTAAELDTWLAATGAERLNIGCRCGPGCLGDDGLIGADADGEQGIGDLALLLGLGPGVLEAAMREYRESGTFWLNLGTAAYVTQSGGLRALWRARAGAKLRTVGKDKGHQGLRLMWAGSQAVLPPSVGADGAYRWLPGHSPWQIGFGLAPTSVQVVMAGSAPRMHATVDVFSTPLPASPAATANLGPDRDGAMVDASWLPYDLDLLRDGVPQGQRSEAVRRLELQMLAAGWSTEQVVAALAGQPWVRRMRRNILGWLTADGMRAQEWRTEQAVHVPGEDTAHATDPEAGARIEAVSAQPVGPALRDDQYKTTDAPPATPAWAYGRQRDGIRLRTQEPERDKAIREGLREIHNFVAGLPHPTRSHQRILRQTERLQGSYDRCRQQAMAHRQELRDGRHPHGVGGAWLWTDAPCDGRGHEECAPFHALRELRAQWGPALEEVYGSGPVVALALSAPGWGLEATRKASTAFLAGSKVRAALGLCAGFLIFEPGAAPGYTLHLLVPFHRAGDLRDLLLREWRRHVACGWLRTVDDLPPQPTALEALVELRVRSEQSILLALGRDEVELDRAVSLYATETGALSGSNIGGQRQRLVMAPGMRRLADEIAEKGRPLAAAVGDETGWARFAAVRAAAGASQAPSPPTPGKGPGGVHPFPLLSGAVPGEPSPPGPGGVPAAPRAAPAGDDDEGWVPCPWDPSLEMRPSRTRKGRPRALPWWKLEQMAARGEVVPIIHNGRLIGYRERAAGSRTS